MLRYFWNLAVIALGAMVFLGGCGPKQRLTQGEMDTPESHVNQGMRKLDEGRLDEARTEFQSALDLNAKYPPAWAGLSLVSAARGSAIPESKSKVRKQHLKDAEKYLEKAENLGKKDASVWIAHIRVNSLAQDDEDWIKDCREGFDQAVKLQPRNDEAYYWMGMAYRQAYEFRLSEDMLRSSIDIDGFWAEEAGQELRLVHQIVEAQPGTKHGQQIALVNKISRADLAVLFIEELNVVQRIQRREEVNGSPNLSFKPENPMANPLHGVSAAEGDITDIENHWAQSMIRDFVKTGLFEVMQDHKFYPDSAVTRIEFAAAVQQLMFMISLDQSLFTKYAGEAQSHITDLRTDHPYYGAAMLCVERGVMDLDKINGQFHPQGTITGPDALLIIRDVKNALKW